jgi:hypothetical protein
MELIMLVLMGVVAFLLSMLLVVVVETRELTAKKFTRNRKV